MTRPLVRFSKLMFSPTGGGANADRYIYGNISVRSIQSHVCRVCPSSFGKNRLGISYHVILGVGVIQYVDVVPLDGHVHYGSVIWFCRSMWSCKTMTMMSDGHVDHVAGGEPSSSVEQHVRRLRHYLVRRHLLRSANTMKNTQDKIIYE